MNRLVRDDVVVIQDEGEVPCLTMDQVIGEHGESTLQRC